MPDMNKKDIWSIRNY